MSKFCGVIIFLSSFNYKLLQNAVLRLSDISLQAIGGAKSKTIVCLFCKTAAVGKGQVNGNIFHSWTFLPKVN